MVVRRVPIDAGLGVGIQSVVGSRVRVRVGLGVMVAGLRIRIQSGRVVRVTVRVKG